MPQYPDFGDLPPVLPQLVPMEDLLRNMLDHYGPTTDYLITLLAQVSQNEPLSSDQKDVLRGIMSTVQDGGAYSEQDFEIVE